MTPIPNGSTPSAEPHDGTIEQTTDAAVGGVSATIPDDVLDAAHAIRERIEGWSGGQTASIIARAIMSAKAEQREHSALFIERRPGLMKDRQHIADSIRHGHAYDEFGNFIQGA